MPDNTPTSLNCPACGAPLDYDGSSTVIRCKFCGNVSVMPASLQPQTTAPAALEEIRKLAAGGNIIDALKRYREVYGVGLQEAKDAVDALQAGRMAEATSPGMRPPDELTKALHEVTRYLAAGNKIEAIKVYRQYYDVGLERAKYAVDQIEAGQTTFPEAGFETAEVEKIKTAATQANKKFAWVGCAVPIFIILLVGGILAFVFLKPGGALTPHYYTVGPVTVLGGSESTAPDFGVNLFDPDKDIRFIGMVEGTSGKLLWHGDKLSGSGIADALTSDSDRIFVANTTDLIAYNKSDGSLAWQASMPDTLNYGASTILVVGGYVITDNADQSIQGYNASTGALAWSRRLNGYDRTLRLVGNSLLIVDYAGSASDYSILLVNPADGQQQQMLNLTCTHDDYTFNAVDPDAGFIYDQPANALFIVSDSSYGCVQRVDLASDGSTWQVTADSNFNFEPDGFQYLQTDSTFYFTNENDLVSVDKKSGSLKVLLTNSDYSMLPLAISGDNLILRARRTRGTEKYELWAVNATSGQQAWQVTIENAQPIDPPNEMAGLIDDTGFGWTWKLLPAGLEVVKFEGKPNQIVVDTYDPLKGSSLGEQTIAMKNINGDFYDIPKVLRWQGSLVYLDIETDIYSLDLVTGKFARVY